MIRTLLERQENKEKIKILPHALNFLLKEEIVKRLNFIDDKKVSYFKKNIKEKKTNLCILSIAEKIIGGF